MSIKTTTSDVLWSYLGTGISMSLNLILLPILVYFLSGDELGIWYVFVSIGSIASLFDFGFNPTVARNVAYAWSGAGEIKKVGVRRVSSDNAGPNYLLLKRLCHTCRLLYFVIAVVALLALTIVGTPYIEGLAGGLSMRRVLIAWTLYLTALFFNLYYGYYETLLRGVGAVKKYNQILVASRAIQIVVSVILLGWGLGIVAPAIGYFLYGLLLRLLSKRGFYKFNKIGDSLKRITDNEPVISETWFLFKTIWHNAWRDGIVSISTYLSSQVTVLISTNYLTLAETGIYSISIQLVSAISTLAGVGFTAAQPSMQSNYVSGNSAEVKRLFSKAMAEMMTVFIICMTILLTVGIPILSWLRPSATFSISVITYLGIYNFLYRYQQLCCSFISNANTVPYVWLYLGSSIVGVVLCFTCCAGFNLGVWGLLLGQSIPQIVNFIKWPQEAFSLAKTSLAESVTLGFTEVKQALIKESKRMITGRN